MVFFVRAISVRSGETGRMRIPCVLKFSDCFKNFANTFVMLLRCACDLYLLFKVKRKFYLNSNVDMGSFVYAAPPRLLYLLS